MPPRKDGPNRTLDILNNIAEQDFLGTEVVQNLREQGLRVERITISLIRPDPAQPRRILPETIHQAFHNQEITPVQALRQYVEKVRITARQKGRPFENLLDLLSASDESGDSPDLTPPERDLRDLTNLALTLRDDGQVNPLTIIDRTEGVVPTYIIETGERRYWANYIDQEFIPGYQGDGTIPCIILPPGQGSIFRQAKENTSRSGLNAIAMARQAALLILAAHDIYPPAEGVVSNDFYRQALELHLRAKQEFTSDILTAMGGISRTYLSRIKALIGLSDEALELADTYSLDEGRLRYVLSLSPEHHYEMVRQIIDLNLTMKQVKSICELQETPVQEQPHEAHPKQAIQLVRLMNSKQIFEAKDIAEILLEQQQDRHSARARLQRLRELLDETERYLER